MGLDHLETFVHQRGRVDGYLIPHRPGRMGKGLIPGHRRQLLACLASKRTTRAGDDGGADRFVSRRLDELKERRVLGVHRQDADVVPGGKIHDEIAGAHNALLVGQGQRTFDFERRDGRFESGESHDRVEDQVRVHLADEARGRPGARAHPQLRVERQAGRRRALVFDGDIRDPQRGGLLEQAWDVPRARKSRDGKAGRSGYDLQSLHADGARGAEDENAPHATRPRTAHTRFKSPAFPTSLLPARCSRAAGWIPSSP